MATQQVQGEGKQPTHTHTPLTHTHDHYHVTHHHSGGVLGSVDISPQPDERTDKLDEAEIGAIQFVEAREDAAKVLELVDTTLDQMPFAVEPGIVGTLHLGGLMRRDDRFSAQRLDVGDERRTGIPAISDHALEREAIQQGDCLGTVMALSRRQQHPQRVA